MENTENNNIHQEENINAFHPETADIHIGSQNDQKEKCCCNKQNMVLWIVIVVLILAVGALFFLHFRPGKNETEIKIPVASGQGAIAYVNSDSVWVNYTFVKDYKKKIEAMNTKLQQQYSEKAKSFQTEYNTYLKNGTEGKLSLDEQKKTEQMLAEKQQHLAGLDQEFSAQLAEAQSNMTIEIQDTIYSFLKRYNKKAKFTYIMAFSRAGGGLLYGDESLDITKDVTRCLNEEYINMHKK